MTIPVSTNSDTYAFYGPIQAITVTGSPFVIKCPDDDSSQPSARLFINGGEIQGIRYNRALWDPVTDWISIGSVLPVIDLHPGDSIEVTYTTAPTMNWCAY